MKDKIILLLIGFIVLFSGVNGAGSLRVDSTTTTPSIIKAGDEVDLTARVQNVVTNNELESKYSYVLKLETSESIAEENIIILDGEDRIGTLDSNEYWNADFKFKVKEGAPSSGYSLDLVILKYSGNLVISEIKSEVKINVIGETFFVIDSEDRTIQQGETKEFVAYIENVGGSDAGSVKLRFGNSDSIQIVGTNTFYFDNVGSFEKEKFNVTFHASNNLESGTYNFPISVEYNDGTQIRVQEIEGGIVVGGSIDLRVASIETTPKEIRPGDNYVLVSLNLENAGEDAAKSIGANLDSENFDSSYSNNNYVYAGRIDSGTYSNMKFYIDVPKDTKSGVYNLDLDLKYLNLMNEEFSDTLVVPLSIKEKPILEIKSVDTDVLAGDKSLITIEIENLGEENAEEVDIRLISDSSNPIKIEERSYYIGSVKSNESKNAVFTIDVDREAEINDYNVRAFIRARGDSEIGDNNIYTYNKDVDISVTGKAMNTLAVGGILFVGLVFVGLAVKRKKGSKVSKK